LITIAVNKPDDNQGVVLKLNVIQNANSFRIISWDEKNNSIKVKVKEKAMKGKANLEIIKRFRRILKSEVKLLRGAKSKQKELLVSGKKPEIFHCLETFQASEKL